MLLDMHVMIVKSQFNKDITDQLLHGATSILDKAKASYEIFEVPGIFEIPAAVKAAIKGMEFAKARRRFSGYLALGCAIRGETPHFDHIATACNHGLMQLSLDYTLAMGNGVLTVENYDQALERAAVDKRNIGGYAAEVLVAMLEHKAKFALFPRT